MSSALAGAFRNTVATYSLANSTVQFDGSGAPVFGDSTGTITIMLKPSGRQMRLPENAKYDGVLETIEVRMLDPVRLPNILKTGSELIVNDAILVLLAPTSSPLEVVTDILGQKLRGYLIKNVYTTPLTLETVSSINQPGIGISETWASSGVIYGFMRTLDADGKARYQQAGFSKVSHEISVRSDAVLEYGKFRFTLGGRILRPVAPPFNPDNRGAVRVVAVSEETP